jgi:hypothetical protein
MALMMELEEIENWSDAFSGFLCGTLFLGGPLAWIFAGLFFPVSAALSVLGLVTGLDGAFPYGRQPHLFSIVGGFLAGAVALIAVATLGVMLPLLSVAALLSTIRLGARIINESERMKKSF